MVGRIVHIVTMANSKNSQFSEETVHAMFGHEAAENEKPERLREYYFVSQAYDRVTADLPLRILVGQKGIGKSALFAVAQSEDGARGSVSISIRPDDVAEVQNEGADFNKKIAEWKEGLFRIVERIILERAGASVSNTNAALKKGGRFLSLLKSSTKPYLLNKVDLDPLAKAFAENFLKTNRLTVYIDDLDRGWQGAKTDVNRLSALLSALRDLSSANDGLRFRVALRSDVYFAVRTSDESTDKLEGSVVWHSWSNHQILTLLIKRLLTYFGEPFDEAELLAATQARLAEHLHKVMVPTFRGQGKWQNVPIHRVLMTMVRQRPRDMVKLCTLAARHASQNGRDLIATEDFRAIFEDYSQGRIQDAINEHRSELPEIERLIMGMKPTRRTYVASESYLFKTDQLLERMKNLISQGTFRFASGKEATARELAAFLYKIDFLIARKDTDNEIHRRYFEQSRYLSSKFADFGYDWEVHPAYRWALQPDNISRLFNDIQPTTDGD
jgi:hypothetical protein